MRTRQSLPAFAPLPAKLKREKAESRSEALLRVLRRIAIAHRTEQTQTFYSRRTIAGHFKLPLSLVSRVFLRLEEEGLLSRIRGSRTVLRGLKHDRRLHVRGVVGLPVSSTALRCSATSALSFYTCGGSCGDAVHAGGGFL